jgi:hypothetical protein
MSEEKRRCAATTYAPGVWGGAACSNPAKYEHNGKWWCGVHNPEAKARRKDKTIERLTARAEVRRRRSIQDQAKAEAWELVREMASIGKDADGKNLARWTMRAEELVALWEANQ